jgi:hypothetical protein
MTDRGNVGLVCQLPPPNICRSYLTVAVQPTGNGPISNAAPFVATAGALINLNGLRGAQMDKTTANSSGIWSFYDLSTGRYFATEAGRSRQWQIDVAADLSFTVTPITSSFPRTYGWASA